MIESDYVFLKPLQLPDAEAQVGRGSSGAGGAGIEPCRWGGIERCGTGPSPGAEQAWMRLRQLALLCPAGCAIAFPIAAVKRRSGQPAVRVVCRCKALPLLTAARWCRLCNAARCDLPNSAHLTPVPACSMPPRCPQKQFQGFGFPFDYIKPANFPGGAVRQSLGRRPGEEAHLSAACVLGYLIISRWLHFWMACTHVVWLLCRAHVQAVPWPRR